MAANPMSSYAVQMREYERRLLRAALDECEGDLDDAAALLGINRLHLKGRCTYLGGVLDKTKHEPPLAEIKVVNQIVRKKEERAVAREERKALAEQQRVADLCRCGEISGMPDGTHVPECSRGPAHPTDEETHA
jgi:hypothetical protein